MTEKRYRVHEFVRFSYSEIGEYIDEHHTDKPLRNDEVVDLLNDYDKENEQLKKEIFELKYDMDRLRINNKGLRIENEQLKQQIKDLRLEVLDSLHDVDDIQCSCNPCVVEECVKKVVE